MTQVATNCVCKLTNVFDPPFYDQYFRLASQGFCGNYCPGGTYKESSTLIC